MTTDPALANLHTRSDRLAEVEGMLEQGHWDEDWARGDIKWLIEEVKRLRNEGGPCGWCARIRAEERLASAAPPPDDQHRQREEQD